MPHENVPPFMESPTLCSGYIVEARCALAASSEGQGRHKGGLDTDDKKNARSPNPIVGWAVHGLALIEELV